MVSRMRNCPECGKLFVDIGKGMCEDCLKKEEENEVIVSDYLRDHPDSSVKKVSEDTGVKEKIIMRMIKAGKLIGRGASYPCEKCGKMITEGRYCSSCAKEIKTEIEHIKASMVKNHPSAKNNIGNSGKNKTTLKSRGMYFK